MRNTFVATALMLGTVIPAMAQSDTIKIAYIEPLSGGGASVGDGGLKHFQFFAEQINASGGINGKKIEILPLDNKTNPQESLVQAQEGHRPRRSIPDPGQWLVSGLGTYGIRSQEQRPQS